MASVTTSGEQILLNGQPHQFRGINVYCDAGGNDNGLDQWGTAGVLSLFPKIDYARINMFGYPSVALLQPFIAQLTAAGVVCELEDHNYPTCLTGSALSNAAGWYHTLAAAFVGNGLVVFGTQNEPDLSSGWAAIDTEIQTIVSAIRGAGNNNLIVLCPEGGYNTSGLNGAAYKAMQNVAWDVHYYDWISQNSTDLATVVAALNTEIANAEATAPIPVAVMEYGIASSNSVDPGGNQVVQAVQQSGRSCAAWAYTSGDPSFPLLLNSGSGNPAQGLTAFGATTAKFIGQGGGITPPPPPPPPTGAATFCWPGVGSVTEGGHTYTVDAAGDFCVDGTAVPDGHGTSAAAVFGTVVYGQDAKSQQWYVWANNTFTPATTPPPYPPLAAPAVVAKVEVEVWDQLALPGGLEIPVTLQ